jgi:glycosyltransferase involved in cell wall biosynthesis
MARADWIVAPSVWWENAPLVLLEARAAGRPAIVSGIGGMAEMVADGRDGIHAPAGDPLGLADAMRRAADTPGLWDRMAAAIRPQRHRSFVDAHLWLYRSLRERAAA